MRDRRLAAIISFALVTIAGVTYGDAVAAQSRAVEAEPQAAPQAALINKYCTSCHNEKVNSGGLVLQGGDVARVGQDVVHWEKAVRKLRARAMPPAGRPKPDEASYESLIAYLETALDREAAAHPNPGRPDTFHRLNRTEYRNAIRDLLSVEIDAAAFLPTDDASHGFDNVNVGGLSPTLLDRYLSAAQKISRLAVGSPVRSAAETTVVLPLDLTQNDQLNDLPFGTRGGTVFRHVFPRTGEYAFQITLARNRDEILMGLTEPQQLELSIDGERIKLFDIVPPRQYTQRGQGQAQPQQADNQPPADAGLVARVPVSAGSHTILTTFIKGPSVLSQADRQPFKADIDPNNRDKAAVFSVSVAGPYGDAVAGDTPSRKRIFTCHPARPADESRCAQTILSTLARRAYRRPAVAAEVTDLLTFYKEGRADGAAFESGIENAIRALLVSPQFLFRIERDPANVKPDTVYQLGDFELASRLSFFLWSSIPDDELLDVAARGKLKEPAVLEQQVKRMLADARSEALVSNFAEQWLYLRNLAAFNPDPRLFPDFDDNLRQAMRRETELFFESIKVEDRGMLDLLQANYTFLNERLAKHYGMPNIYGSHFRRVVLPADSPRGGLLGQASILAVTSYANRTSPVQRGKWVLENIMGMPPPPPPGNVPPLKDNGIGGRVLSMRERMAEHRANAVCASCHQIMDPIGLSTENFDAVGHWRDRTEDGAKVDASGALPDGRAFDGIAGLKKALLTHSDLFVATATEKLMTYALGRGLEPFDAAAVRKITRDAAPQQYKFSSIVLGIVKSVPFTMRKSEVRSPAESSVAAR